MSPSAYKLYVFPVLLMGVFAIAIGSRIPTLSASSSAGQAASSSAKSSHASIISQQLLISGAKSIGVQWPLPASPKPIEPPRKTQPDAPCHKVEAGHPLDVTVPDGQTFHAGEKFSKTWRLVNAGSCLWTEDYQIEWVYGDDISFVNTVMLPQEVNPGEHVDVTVSMLAPETPRGYKSYWKIRSNDGKLFGLGPQGTSPFWADIQVVAP